MQNPFKFYVYEENAYIYDTNQKRIFQMGVEESADVAEDVEATILENGEEVSKDKAWEISGLDKLQPS
ncbi:hypothetical protein [Maridesulfovibrio hydrothermalis]|uniref:Uncharacterized protein n=1 Tax=Maridesulfovibrio hydrothermalis AM13 = DSM 14728 TaxID=1121451 RepID=L0RD20_9BACT|nr:hypothetical protein [Maridesulfovibrio hydrothermalis]CCO24654.1 conserved protein of unknown function [Maridesulfovibrio hydrothermalis AM13 = DSM 14728]